jgi:hypothetical protein
VSERIDQASKNIDDAKKHRHQKHRYKATGQDDQGKNLGAVKAAPAA